MEFFSAHLDVILWSVIGIVLFIIEAVTVNTVSIWFVGGCIAAVVVALLGGPVWLQIALAIGVSGGLLAGCRKMLIGKLATKELKDSVIDEVEGKEAIVTSEISPGKAGQIHLNGIQWSAKSINDDDTFPVNTRVITCRREGLVVYVDKYDIS